MGGSRLAWVAVGFEVVVVIKSRVCLQPAWFARTRRLFLEGINHDGGISRPSFFKKNLGWVAFLGCFSFMRGVARGSTKIVSCACTYVCHTAPP